MQAHSDFLPALELFDLEVLDRSPSVAYGVWPDLRLAYFNTGWERFAAENDGQPEIARSWSLGRAISDALPEVLKPNYLARFQACLNTRTPWQHVYECSSDRTRRWFHMTVYPLLQGSGLLFVHSLVVEEPISAGESLSPLDALYRRGDGFIRHCRRVERADQPQTWDWAPKWVKRPPPETTHGICPVCDKYYLSEQGGDDSSAD